MSIQTLNHNDFIKYAEIKKLRIFEADYKDYNLNIHAVRNNNKEAGWFDDMLYIFWKYKGVWYDTAFRITTDPSDISLIKKSNSLGTAIIAPGQHKSFTFGYHKGDVNHPCLRNSLPITVIRDFNGDKFLDYDKPRYHDVATKLLKDKSILMDYFKNGQLVYREHKGIFYTDVHRASAWKILERVGLYSEGCMVHYDPNLYMKEFIYLIKQAMYNWGNEYTVTVSRYDELIKTISNE